MSGETGLSASRAPDAATAGRLDSLVPVERPIGLVVRIGGGIAVFGASTWIAVEGLPEWEERLFSALNGGPEGLELVFWLPMQFGSLWGPVAVGAFTWWRWRSWRPSVGSVVAGVLVWQVAKVIKAIVDRGRPYELITEFARRTGTPYEGLGFVSGHSAVAFSVAAVLSPYVSRTRPGRAVPARNAGGCRPDPGVRSSTRRRRGWSCAGLLVRPGVEPGGRRTNDAKTLISFEGSAKPGRQGSSIQAGADSSRNRLTSRHRSSTSQSISSPMYTCHMPTDTLATTVSVRTDGSVTI